MQPVRSEDGLTLQRFSVMLTSCKNALKEIGYQSKIENPDTMQRIVEKFPFGWRQKKACESGQHHRGRETRS